MAIKHGKGEFCKIKGSICNIPIEAANICNILPTPAVSNSLIVVKLKSHLKYRGHAHFEPFRSHIVYQTLICLKSYNKFYDNISNANGLSSLEIFKIFDIAEIQWQSECVTEKNVSHRKQMSENINDRNDTEFASVEDPLNMH